MSPEIIARVSETEREIMLPDGTCALVDDDKGRAEWLAPMTAADVGTLRAKACDIMGALGAVLEQLPVIEETLRNPAPDAEMDAAVIASRLENAAEAAEQLAELAHELALAIDKHTTAPAVAGGAL